MNTRSRVRVRIPFSELWGMRIEHPYSLLVRADGLAWSSGQCPLARDGAVLAPDDIDRQADHVAGFIVRILESAAFSPANVGKLVLYHVPSESARFEGMMNRFRPTFPGAILMPVGIPYFYYPGMLLEVDVHAAECCVPMASARRDAEGFRIQTVDAGPLIWVKLEILVEPNEITSAGPLVLNTDAVLDAIGSVSSAPVGTLLADHWFVASTRGWPVLQCLREAGFVTDPGSAVTVALPRDVAAMGELTFARDRGARPLLIVPPLLPGTSIFARSSRDHFWISARSVVRGLSLIGETQAIMAAIEQVMCDRAWQFSAICKATTHYVGSNAASDLHENMLVRNAYYRRPGPASTGLPVTAFPFASSKIAVDVLGVIE